MWNHPATIQNLTRRLSVLETLIIMIDQGYHYHYGITDYMITNSLLSVSHWACLIQYYIGYIANKTVLSVALNFKKKN